MAGLRKHLAVAAATAALLVAGLGTGLSGVASAQTVKAGPPRYYIELGIRSNHPVVRATATGRVTGGRLSCPGGASVNDYVPADHQTFFIACQTSGGGTQIYRFRLTASGRVGALAAVRGGKLTVSAGSLAASADGSTLAVSVGRGASEEAIVINTRTGAHATWTDGAVGPGMIRLGVERLALTGNGRELLDFTIPKCVKGSAGNKCRAPGEEARVVSPASAGGSFASSKLIMRQTAITSRREGYINDVAITPDGRSLVVSVVSGGATINGGFVAVYEVSAATGHVTKVLYKLKTGDGFFYRFVSTDPSGRYVLFDAGPTRGSVNGWIDNGKLIRLRPAGSGVAYEAWSGQ